MAKSLRASSKLAARNRKRYTGTSDYAVVAAARLNQVSSRLAERKNMPKQSELESSHSDALPDVAMQDEQAPRAKISTSGPRNARNERWRKTRGATGSKNGGRTKRRR
ncbi:hypothetical protein MVES_001331 [Malassezia vespertilionis]|uniref:DUF2423 domain-containing protein n=1 Tax=Malassezia vespertilionis TaxID=2020962 RepID=A0A2N1JDY4_9BASI|nr:hypothetical protein MVES_001331 [Malassezia vespertilionis]